MAIDIRELRDGDDAEWLRMRLALWPDGSAAEHEKDMASWRARGDAVVLVASRPIGLAGFAEVGTRPYADGCDTRGRISRGWYVDPEVRRMGVGGALVRAARAWARQAEPHGLASDALLDNVLSHHAHLALGFEEVGRVV